jgi:hypothetical protein
MKRLVDVAGIDRHLLAAASGKRGNGAQRTIGGR